MNNMYKWLLKHHLPILLLVFTCCWHTDCTTLQTPLNDAYNNEGTCQPYDGTECSQYLQGKHVHIKHGESISHLERKLKRWFKQNRKDGQITRECWPHAEALTCMHIYPECSSKENQPVKTSLCSSHCSFLKQHVCKGEFKRAMHSALFREFIPPCEEVSLIDDPKGKFCYFLPTINFSEGPVPYPISNRTFHVNDGKPVYLKCAFGIKNFAWQNSNLNKYLVTEGTWYFNHNRIPNNRRYVTKTEQKKKSRLRMTLKIRKVSPKDAGKYRCIITFAKRTVEATAQLVVKQSKVVSIVKEITGSCVKYPTGICSAYFNEKLGTDMVVENNLSKINLVNAQLAQFIQRLQRINELSKKCAEFGQAVLCYNKFQYCDNRTNEVSASLCKRDCELFHTEYCKKELNYIRHEKLIMTLFIPQCEFLEEQNPKCLPLSPKNDLSKIKNGIHSKFTEMHCYDKDSRSNYLGTVSMTHNGKFCDLWKNYKDYENVPHDYCRNFGENQPWCFVDKQKTYCSIKPCEPICYNGNGEDYYGSISETNSGHQCLYWNEVAITFVHSNIDHNHCRNFDGSQAPYCYVDREKKEYCNIQKCMTNDQVKDSAIPLVVYTVPSVIGAAALIFSLFLLLFYMKNKKILQLDKSSKNKFIISQSDLQDGTLSTTSSFELHKPFPDIDKSSLLNTPLSLPPTSPPLLPPPSIKLTSEEEICESKRSKQSHNVPEVKQCRLLNMTKIGDVRLAHLWQGEFVECRNKKIAILVQKVRPDTRSIVVSEFRVEMNILRGLKHRNLQRVICVSKMSEIPFIAFDGKEIIDLKEYLKANQNLSYDFLIKILHQIAAGLDYMHSRKIVHKDIAARNCFISQTGQMKISHCQLGKCRYPMDYAQVPTLGWSPIRWLSSEVFDKYQYEPSTDVYMFGILIWEVFTNGIQPYSEYDDNEAIERIINNVYLQHPTNCPDNMWSLMQHCWATPACQRPQVKWLKEQLVVKTSQLTTQNILNNNYDTNSLVT